MYTWFSTMVSVPEQFFWLTGKGSYVSSAIPNGTQPPPPHQGTNVMVVNITSISHTRCFLDIIIQSQFPSQYFCAI